MRSHKIYWDLTRSTRISQDLPRSHFEITLRLHFGICHVTCETWHLNILHFNVDILAFDTEIVLIFWNFIFDIWHWHFVYMLRFWEFDMLTFQFWNYDIWHWHWHFTTTLSQYHCWILRLSAIQKKSADSAVIYHGFCGYLSWILWLSILDSVVIYHGFCGYLAPT